MKLSFKLHVYHYKHYVDCRFCIHFISRDNLFKCGNLEPELERVPKSEIREGRETNDNGCPPFVRKVSTKLDIDTIHPLCFWFVQKVSTKLDTIHKKCDLSHKSKKSTIRKPANLS